MEIRNITCLTIAAITSVLGGCTTQIVKAEAEPKIVATHSIICDLVQTIAEDTIDLTCLIEGDQDPHTFRPTPAQRKAIEEAQLIFYGGYQLEPLVIKLLAENETPKFPLYETAVTEPIQAKHDEAHGEGHDEAHGEAHDEGHDEAHGEEHGEAHGEGHDEAHGEEHGEAHGEGHDEAHGEEHKEKPNKNAEAELQPDPHVWHNVENTVAMVEILRDLFVQANPSAVDIYLKNSADLTDKLWGLDSWIKNQIATIPEGQKVLVTTHNSLNYYVQAYRLEDYQSLKGLSTEASSSATDIGDLAEKIKQAGVPTIFAESTANDRVISNVARTADVELSKSKLFVDGLGTTNSYAEMMAYNTCAIVDGLGGKCKPFKDAK